MNWSLGIQRYSPGFESQWQWVRSVIITEAVFRSFLITPRWFPRTTLVSTSNKKAAEVKFEIGKIMQGKLSAHLLSLHNRAGVAGNRSALTSHRLKCKALVQIWHLFNFIYQILIEYIIIVVFLLFTNYFVLLLIPMLYIILLAFTICNIFLKFRILYLMLQNDFLLWQMYFLSLGSVLQLSGAIPQFFGELPQFLGELPKTQGEGIENVPRGQRNSATCPKSLNLLPKAKSVITTIRQPKEVSLMCYSSTW